MKRMISLLLSLLLMAAMATTASAVDLTVSGQAGHRYIAFQIFKGDAVELENKDILGNVEWGNGIKSGEAVVNALRASTDTITDSTGSGNSTTLAKEFSGVDYLAQNVAKAMATWGNNLDRIKAFAELMYDADLLVVDNGVRSKDVNGVTVIQDLEPGYYLIMDAAIIDAGANGPDKNLERDFYTNILMSLTTSTEITVKGSVPTVDKLVSNYLNVTGTYGKTASNQINLDHYYQLTGTVASEIADYDTYFYQFKDTLSKGLAFNRIEEVAIKTNTGEILIYKADATDNRWDAVTNHKFEDHVLTVTFNDLKAELKEIHNIRKGDEIVVRYSAQLKPDNLVVAEGGNPNQVTLIYGNNPYGNGKGESAPSEARVYTFPMEVLKVNEKGESLEGAKFVLYHMHDNVRLYAKIDNGIIIGWTEVVDGTDEGNSVDEEVQAAITAGSISVLESADGKTDGIPKGQIKVTGLKAKTDYFLSEIEPPAGGYNKPLTDTEVQITDFTISAAEANKNKVITLSYEVNNEPKTVSAEKNEAMVVSLSITNKLGTVLPSTGGMGTTVLYVVGGILVLAAVVLLITKKRMKDAE